MRLMSLMSAAVEAEELRFQGKSLDDLGIFGPEIPIHRHAGGPPLELHRGHLNC